MRIIAGRKQKGQAITELALFSGLVLMAVGAIISHVQRSNDQQYVQMEVFRRALERAATFKDPHQPDGIGASVQFTALQNRRHADISSGFRKGSSQTFGAGANVFWAVPRMPDGADDHVEAPNLIVYRINEDEAQWNYRSFVPRELDSTDDAGNERQRYWVFEPEDMSTDTQVAFNESLVKEENHNSITTVRNSEITESLHMNIPYTRKIVDKDNDDFENIIDTGTLWDLRQNLYRDAGDGQYKYNQTAPAAPIQRSRTWQTDF